MVDLRVRVGGLGRSQIMGTGGFPPGVTLVAIDGGNTFYADNGLTYAAAAGWDDPDFFPIGQFLEPYRSAADAAKWSELGINLAIGIQSDLDNSLMNTNGVFLIVQADEWLSGGNPIDHMTLLDNCVGINAKDEPSLYTHISTPISQFPNAQQDGRLWYTNYTYSPMVFGELNGHLMPDLHDDEFPTPNATTRHLNLVGMDIYFYCGGYDDAVPTQAGQIYALGRVMTQDELQRGIHYLDCVRWMRKGNTPQGDAAWQPTYPAPASIYVETGSPYDDNEFESEIMRSAWINAATWGAIIGGARMLKYFTQGDGFSGTAGPAYEVNGLIKATSVWDTPHNGDSISNYDQVAATNALVTSLASVINSPFAEGYCTVDPPAVVLSTSGRDTGFEIMVKYHNRGSGANNKFYIFAMPRYGLRIHNNSGVDTGAESWPKTATFTIANTGATQVTVINESRTISVTGGTTFQDSFADPHTVHIYRVD